MHTCNLIHNQQWQTELQYFYYYYFSEKRETYFNNKSTSFEGFDIIIGGWAEPNQCNLLIRESFSLQRFVKRDETDPNTIFKTPKAALTLSNQQKSIRRENIGDHFLLDQDFVPRLPSNHHWCACLWAEVFTVTMSLLLDLLLSGLCCPLCVAVIPSLIMDAQGSFATAPLLTEHVTVEGHYAQFLNADGAGCPLPTCFSTG